jgi:hypothetical protein
MDETHLSIRVDLPARSSRLSEKRSSPYITQSNRRRGPPRADNFGRSANWLANNAIGQLLRQKLTNL